MTNHDHHRDGEQAENTKPNYTLRRIKTLLAVIACTASATLLFTWRTADSRTATALAARTACQAIDKALKRHLERGGDSDTTAMLTGLHIDPMGDIRDGRS